MEGGPWAGVKAAAKGGDGSLCRRCGGSPVDKIKIFPYLLLFFLFSAILADLRTGYSSRLLRATLKYVVIYRLRKSVGQAADAA